MKIRDTPTAMKKTAKAQVGHVLLRGIGSSTETVKMVQTANRNQNHDGTLGVVIRIEDVDSAAEKAASRW